MPSNGNRIVSRFADLAAVALVGDGVLTCLMPERQAQLWYHGPDWWEAIHRPLLRRPTLVRLLAVTAAGLGVWIATRERVE